MSSPSHNVFRGSFLGVAADVEIEKVPFVAQSVKFWTVGGVWGTKLVGEDGMDSDNYLSSAGVDTGVTVDTDGKITVASGADVNSVGNLVYYEAIG